MGLAVRIPLYQTIKRSTQWSCTPTPRRSREFTASRENRGEAGKHFKEWQLPHLSPQLCHSHPRRRLRHSNGAGTARTQRRQNNNDLYPRFESRRPRCQKPARLLITRSQCQSQHRKKGISRNTIYGRDSVKTLICLGTSLVLFRVMRVDPFSRSIQGDPRASHELTRTRTRG